MQLIDLLGKSEFLECNETESIADYLLKQRVISDQQYLDIISSKPIKVKNKLLIEILNSNSIDEENENINIYGLFVNALRYAGCHYMANILDVDEPLLGNCDNNNTRKKGQISINVQVSAVQIKAKHLLSRQASLLENCRSLQGNNNSIWLDKTTIIFGTGDNCNGLSKNPRKRKGPFYSLLCCIHKSKHSSKYKHDPVHNLEMYANNDNPPIIDHGHQVKIDILAEKSIQLYTHLNNSSSSEREALIKYFEQSHQILVFETKYDETAMIITVICTKQDTLFSLQTLIQTGQLEKDFNTLLLSKSVFEQIDVKDIRLSINILPDELNCAMQELDLSKKKRM